MFTISILGFFSLVLLFFFSGKNDFGIKPSSSKVKQDIQNNPNEEKAILEESEN